MLIDTHCHLNDEKLVLIADDIVADMQKDGLSTLIDVGYDRPSSELCYLQSQKYKDVYSVVGIHPHDSKLATRNDYDRFAEMSKNDKVVAIGEIGLDFYYDLSDRDVQERVFLEELELADALNMPVVIHLRDAYELMLKLLKENKHRLKNGALLHCYSGSLEMMKEFSKLDMYFSFGGAITFKNAKKGEIIQSVPTDRILLETDCPYMTPVPYRGSTNQPKYVNLVKDKMQEFLPDIDVEKITTENAVRFFRKIKIK